MRSSILNDLEEEPLYWFLHPDAFQHKYLVSKKLVPDGGSEAHDNIKKYISQMKTRHADGDWEQAVVSQLCQIYADNQYLQIRLRSRLDKLEIVLDTDKAWAQQDLSYIMNTCLLWLRRLRRRLIILGLSRENPTAVGNIVKDKAYDKGWGPARTLRIVREFNSFFLPGPHQALLRANTVAKQNAELESEKPQVQLPVAATLSVCRGSGEHDADTSSTVADKCPLVTPEEEKPSNGDRSTLRLSGNNEEACASKTKDTDARATVCHKTGRGAGTQHGDKLLDPHNADSSSAQVFRPVHRASLEVARFVKQEEPSIAGAAESVTPYVPAFCTQPNDNAKDPIYTTIKNGTAFGNETLWQPTLALRAASHVRSDIFKFLKNRPKSSEAVTTTMNKGKGEFAKVAAEMKKLTKLYENPSKWTVEEYELRLQCGPSPGAIRGYHQDRAKSATQLDFKVIYRFPEDGVSASPIWFTDKENLELLKKGAALKKECKYTIAAGQPYIMCNRILYKDWGKAEPMETRIMYFHTLKEYRGLSYIIGGRFQPGVKMTDRELIQEMNLVVKKNSA